MTKMESMGKSAALALAAAAALASFGGAEDVDIKYKPLQFGAVQEFGMIQKGLLVSTPVTEFTDEWVDHFGTFFVQEAVVDDRLVIKAGLGGIFQFPKPENAQEEYGGSQYKMFFIGPSIAEAMYHFGGAEDSKFSLGGGMFPYKYNPDASNLGEYLFRSGPYPSYLITGGSGGLTVIGDQFTVMQGFRGAARLGSLSLDVILSTETGLPPLYDWSLGAVANWSIGEGLLEIGAGLNWKRILVIDPKKTRREERENSYFNRGGKDYVGEARWYSQPAQFYGKLGDSLVAIPDSVAGSAALHARGAVLQSRRDSLNLIADAVSKDTSQGGWNDPATGMYPGAKFFTPAGIVGMARISLDLKKLFASDAFSKEDLRIFAEAAVLGVQNYPVYYENIMDRLPVMAGMNIPTFGLLDLFAVQVEYYKSPNLSNTYALGEKNWAIPFIPEGADANFSKDDYNDLSKEDDIAWSILLRKRVWNSLSFNAQFARDHLRTVGTDWFYGGRLEPQDILHKTSSWYWMFQLGWNI